jgi:hypothetical protein
MSKATSNRWPTLEELKAKLAEAGYSQRADAVGESLEDFWAKVTAHANPDSTSANQAPPQLLPQSARLGKEHQVLSPFPASLTHGNPSFEDAAYRGYTLAPLWDNPSNYDKQRWAWGYSVRGRYGDIVWPDGTPLHPQAAAA